MKKTETKALRGKPPAGKLTAGKPTAGKVKAAKVSVGKVPAAKSSTSKSSAAKPPAVKTAPSKPLASNAKSASAKPVAPAKASAAKSTPAKSAVTAKSSATKSSEPVKSSASAHSAPVTKPVSAPEATASAPNTKTASATPPAAAAAPVAVASASSSKEPPQSTVSAKVKMGKPELKFFENLLNEKKETLLIELGYLEDNTMRLSSKEGAGDLSSHAYHLADHATETQDREQAFHMASREGKYLYYIEEALDRVRNGSFGICKKCGKLIPKARLEAVPTAKMCIECKSAQEKAAEAALAE